MKKRNLIKLFGILTSASIVIAPSTSATLVFASEEKSNVNERIKNLKTYIEQIKSIDENLIPLMQEVAAEKIIEQFKEASAIVEMEEKAKLENEILEKVTLLIADIKNTVGTKIKEQETYIDSLIEKTKEKLSNKNLEETYDKNIEISGENLSIEEVERFFDDVINDFDTGKEADFIILEKEKNIIEALNKKIKEIDAHLENKENQNNKEETEKESENFNKETEEIKEKLETLETIIKNAKTVYAKFVDDSFLIETTKSLKSLENIYDNNVEKQKEIIEKAENTYNKISNKIIENITIFIEEDEKTAKNLIKELEKREANQKILEEAKGYFSKIEDLKSKINVKNIVESYIYISKNTDEIKKLLEVLPQKEEVKNENVAKTGDENNILIPSILSVAAGIGVATAVFMKKES